MKLITITSDGQELLTKETIAEAVAELNDRYSDGGLEVNAARDYVQLKALETLIKQSLEVCRPWAIEAISKYSDAERKNLYGAQVSIVSGKAKYDYSICAEIVEKEQVVNDLKASAKDEEKQLKALQEKAIREQRAKYIGSDVPTISVKLN